MPSLSRFCEAWVLGSIWGTSCTDLFWISDSRDFVCSRELSRDSSSVAISTSVARDRVHCLNEGAAIRRPESDLVKALVTLIADTDPGV